VSGAGTCVSSKWSIWKVATSTSSQPATLHAASARPAGVPPRFQTLPGIGRHARKTSSSAALDSSTKVAKKMA